MTSRRWLLVCLACLALFLTAGRLLAGVYAEWSWYAAMDALALYRSRLVHELVLRGGAAAAAFVFAFGNIYAVRKSIVSLVLPRRLGNLDIGEAVPGRFLTMVVVVLSAVMAVLLALPVGDWTTFALARIGQPFNETDPYLDHEFGFYVYRLPFERALHLWTVVAVLAVSMVVVALYALTPSVRWERGRLHLSTYVRRHFAVLAALALATIAWSYRIEGFSLLVHGSGANEAFSAFDHRVAIPLLTGLSIGSLVAAAVVLWSEWHGYHRATLAILSVMLVAGPGSQTVLPLLSRWSGSESEQRARERPYRTTRRLFTARAFGVDEVVHADSVHAVPVAREALAVGVSAWDPAAIIRSAESEHQGFSVAALGWTPTAGGLSATVLQRPDDGLGRWTTWRVDASAVDEHGRTLQAAPDSPETEGAIPSILVEEGAPPYAVVPDSTGRIVSPSFALWWERLAHAWRLQDPRLLLREVPLPRPRIALHRDVRGRIEALAPFFTLGPSLGAIARGDSIYWVGDLYTTSPEYPLAEPMLFAGEVRRYVRHAATAIVQAQTGRVFILADARPDAIARSWIRRFPELFATHSALPTGLEALRPPAFDWAALQGSALLLTGAFSDSLRPSGLTRTDDADIELAGGGPALFAFGGATGPLAWSVGAVDAGDRLLGVLVARGGEILRTEWHGGAIPMRWGEVLERMQLAADSVGIGRAHHNSRRGRVRVIPSADGPVFVQTFYDWPPDGSPSILGVVVLERGIVRVAPTASDAFGLFREATGSGGMFRARVAALYETMSAAMRRGDWRAFGSAYSTLGRVLRERPPDGPDRTPATR